MAEVERESQDCWDQLEVCRARLVSKFAEWMLSQDSGMLQLLGLTGADDVIDESFDESFDVSAILEKARHMEHMEELIPLLEGIVRFLELKELISDKRSEISTQVNSGCISYSSSVNDDSCAGDGSFFNDLDGIIKNIAYTEQLIEKINRQIVDCYGGCDNDRFTAHMANALDLMQEVMELESECKTIAFPALAEPAKN